MPHIDDKNDPRSYEYRMNRPLYRPDIHIGRAIFKMFFPILLIVFCLLIAHTKGWLQQLGEAIGFHVHPLLLGTIITVVYVGFRMRSIVIWFIRLYQHYAPDDVRRMCHFVPSCSEYMILAVEKYGVIRGVIKGWNRLSRCHGDAGGIDEP